MHVFQMFFTFLSFKVYGQIFIVFFLKVKSGFLGMLHNERVVQAIKIMISTKAKFYFSFDECLSQL